MQTLPPRPLTGNEKRILEYIEDYIQTHGIPPSFKDIKDHFGFASFNSVQRYLKQLQNKEYIFIPPGNQKRAINILQSSSMFQNSVGLIGKPTAQQPTPIPFSSTSNLKREAPAMAPPITESLSLPLLGRVAAGLPLEALEHNEFVEVPARMVRHPQKTYALRVVGESMIEDGILDGDIIFVEKRSAAKNGETIVAVIENEATVKKFFIHINPQTFQHSSEKSVELRPANSSMQSLWYSQDQVQVQGIVVGLLRQF